MKKKKTIMIKNPKLRKIRDNLRMLLIKWQIMEWNLLNDEYERIRFDEDHRSRTLSQIERKQVDSLRKRMRDLNGVLDSSICKCTVCGAPDKDMTYNPIEKRWFCVDCYKLNQDFYKDTDQAYLYP